MIMRLNLFKRNTNDSLIRLLVHKYRLNLLSVPQENVSVGDIYATDVKILHNISHSSNIGYLLDTPLDLSKIGTLDQEFMADVFGTTSNNIPLDFGFRLLEGFLNALSLVGVGENIRKNYEA
jgi:hypothetical protein